MKKLTQALESIPGIGKSLAEDLRVLGIQKSSDLVGKDPEKMYKKLMALHGTHIDRCVLYTFRCAVYCASTKSPDLKKTLWWNWMDTKI